MKPLRHQISGSFLAFVMTLYVGCVITLTHAHVINGVIVVHSHPDYWGDNDDPWGDHSTTELVFFHQLSTLLSCVGGFFTTGVPEILETGYDPSFIKEESFLITPYSCIAISLRAPPVLPASF